ncbi:hypothetical protein ARMSODRAFT_349550 [Armillaria solidipes]|uniref:Uncharacterized protein n=1 Tax=Armillaria solidipes TaxID=1076256 RepID=A0A2H3BRN0_9AGAR|nr:hypothetical protein ARMSODRAFT_349550 [Armillaria solidipes]
MHSLPKPNPCTVPPWSPPIAIYLKYILIFIASSFRGMLLLLFLASYYISFSFAKTKIIGRLVSTINLVVEIGTKYHRTISDVAEDLSAILCFSDTQRFILDPQLPPRYLANSQNLVSDISHLHLHVRGIVKAFNKRDLLTLVAGRTGRMVSYLCLAVGGALGAAQYILPGQFKGFLPASIASVVPRPLCTHSVTWLTDP